MSSGRVAKKIALFEPLVHVPGPVPPAAFTAGIHHSDSSTAGARSPSSTLLLHRKDAIKRKKSQSLANSSELTYVEDYGATASPASSCYSSGGDSGSSGNGQSSLVLDDYGSSGGGGTPTSNSPSSPECSYGHGGGYRNKMSIMKPSNNCSLSSSSVTDGDGEHELYQSSSIESESDYSSNNSSNYYNQNAANRIRIYNNEGHGSSAAAVTLTGGTSTRTITKSAGAGAGTGVVMSTKRNSKTTQQQSALIKDSFMTHGRSRSLKDCYQSFSLPIVPGQLQVVEFTEIKLDSEDDLEADDEEESQSHVQNAEEHDGCEMEPFYEELDNYSNSNGQADVQVQDEDTTDADRPASGEYNHSFLWSKIKAATANRVSKSLTLPSQSQRLRTAQKENEVKPNCVITPTNGASTGLVNGNGNRNANATSRGQHPHTHSRPPTDDGHDGTEPESVYAEPVYNEMSNGSGSANGSVNGNSNGGSASGSGSASYWTPTSSLYNQSRGTLTDANVNGIKTKSESIYSFKSLRNGLKKSQSSLSSLQLQQPLPDPPTPIPCPSSSYYDMSRDELPPVPNSSTTKFSTIAKSAGKKLVKKFQHIRRLSKTGLEGFELPSSLSIFSGNGNSASSSATLYQPTGGGGANDRVSLNSSNGSANASIISLNEPKHIRTRSLSIGNISCNGISTIPAAASSSSSTLYSGGSNLYSGIGPSGMKRSISRPNIPPPLPPPLPLPNPPTQASNSTTVPLPLPQEDDDDDDFDDSDFYDSDSELIRNFVAAVQPIYAMEEEPLYQYYTYGISLQPEDDYQPIIPKNLGLTLDMLVPRTGQRTLWCELPEVVSSGILSILSDKQKQLQEAIFEILTSEVSYLKSLDVLISLFYENEQLIQVLSENDRAALFGNITYVKDCTQTFLTELLAKWEKSWYIQEVGQVIHENANTRFGVYKEYCRNKPYQDKILKRLRSTNDEFVNVVKSIEENPKCQLLQMDSFLMLPMQRITRLPLLVNAIIQRSQSPKEKCHCEDALKSLTNLVIECNEAARESQDAEETSAILERIEFPKGMKSVTNNGQLLLKGDFMRNPFDHVGKGGVTTKINWTFQKNKRVVYWLILFTNQILVTKKKSIDKFEVIEMASPLDANIKPLPNLEGLSKDFQHYFMLHFDRKDTVYFLAARTQSEVERWRQKLDQLKNTKELKVEAIFPYVAKRSDELSFEVGEIIRVEQMQPDGWYYGTKAEVNGNANGVSGWFPGNYCAECS